MLKNIAHHPIQASLGLAGISYSLGSAFLGATTSVVPPITPDTIGPLLFLQAVGSVFFLRSLREDTHHPTPFEYTPHDFKWGP